MLDMKNRILFLLGTMFMINIILLANIRLYAQTDTIKQFVEVSLLGGYTSSDVVPFWMRSNQFGSIPLEGASGSLLIRAAKHYSVRGEWTGRLDKTVSPWDWGYGLEARTNIGHKAQVQLIRSEERRVGKECRARWSRYR